MADAEGMHEGTPCPECGSEDTVRFEYVEGFHELECRSCGWTSDAEELAELQRFAGDLLEGSDRTARPPVPRKPLEA